MPVAADDRTALACRVTATNAAGSAVADDGGALGTPRRRWRRRRSPTSSSFQGEAPGRRGGGGLHRPGLSSRSPAAGRRSTPRRPWSSIPRDLSRRRTVTVTATNSGGSASVTSGSVAVSPALVPAPMLAGTGRSARRSSPMPGWSGKPAPTALQWLPRRRRHRRRDRGELHAGRGRRPHGADLPGDRDQRRRQRRGDDRGAPGDPGGAGGERARCRTRARQGAAAAPWRRRPPSPARAGFAVTGAGRRSTPRPAW